VAAPVGKHLLAALLAERIEALAAELQQLVALGVAQLLAAHKGVGALLAAGDAVAGEHLAHHALPRIRRATSCAGAGLRRPSSSMSIRGW
jgi:acyl-CoA reductase-like NAD-dependent aldehyde dehydrogenase